MEPQEEQQVPGGHEQRAGGGMAGRPLRLHQGLLSTQDVGVRIFYISGCLSVSTRAESIIEVKLNSGAAEINQLINKSINDPLLE